MGLKVTYIVDAAEANLDGGEQVYVWGASCTGGAGVLTLDGVNVWNATAVGDQITFSKGYGPVVKAGMSANEAYVYHSREPR